MVTTIRKWGNSLAVRIPKSFAAEAGLEDESSVEISMDGSSILITPARDTFTLKELVARISRSNIHDEVRWGPAKGRESW